MTAPRDAIAHSQFDDETREMLLAVYDRLQRDYGMDEESAIAVVDRILELADAGERSYAIILQEAAPTASQRR
jgi:hypothetical protein